MVDLFFIRCIVSHGEDHIEHNLDLLGDLCNFLHDGAFNSHTRLSVDHTRVCACLRGVGVYVTQCLAYTHGDALIELSD